MKQTTCPSLLKDLLKSDNLRYYFDDYYLNLLQILIGPPISLNIRNLVWHGFLSIVEAERLNLSKFLLIILGKMNERLKVNHFNYEDNRPLYDLKSYESIFKRMFVSKF